VPPISDPCMLARARQRSRECSGGLGPERPARARAALPGAGGDDTTCPTLPMATSVAVRSADGSTEVARVATDADGQFSMPLDPGQYLVVVPAPDGGGMVAETLVTVLADTPTTLTIQVRPGPRSVP